MTQEQIDGLRGRLRNLERTRCSRSALDASFLIADAVITCAAMLRDMLGVLETSLLGSPSEAVNVIQREIIVQALDELAEEWRHETTKPE